MKTRKKIVGDQVWMNDPKGLYSQCHKNKQDGLMFPCFQGASYTFTDPPWIQATVPYIETEMDEGGSCKRLRICHGSATDLLRSATVIQGQVCRCPFDCFLIRKPFPCQSVADPAMFWAIFVGTEASGMPQAHPGWVYRQ